MAEAWPLSTFPVSALNWKPRKVRRGGGMGITGPGQTGQSAGRWWEVNLPGSVLESQTARRIWDALIDRGDGGFATFEVPYLEETPETGKTARFGAAAALRATQVRIERVAGFSGALALGGPAAFSVTHATQGKRLYRIQRIITANIATNTDLVEINIPLREAVADDQAIDFNTPACLMRIEDPDDEAYPTFDATWTAEVGVRLVEAFEQAI